MPSFGYVILMFQHSYNHSFSWVKIDYSLIKQFVIIQIESLDGLSPPLSLCVCVCACVCVCVYVCVCVCVGGRVHAREGCDFRIVIE